MSANIPASGIAPVPEAVAQSGWPAWFTQIARGLNQALKGKINAATTVTLAASATATTLTDDRIQVTSAVTLEAQTASAATARLTSPGIYVVPTKGSATINHPSNAATDQQFAVLIVG